VLSYLHEYHAGNHADVLKHSVLAILIRALQRKPGALRVIDTHAGSALYDLASEAARRGREYEGGVARLLQAADPPQAIAPYLQAIHDLNPDGGLRYYPGSPEVTRALLREQDHLELFELHPRASERLRERFHRHPQVHVHQRDGFEGLLAVAPPPERRGVILIDPSYEQRSDYARTVEAVGATVRRWANAVIAVWYPLIGQPDSGRMIDRLARLKLPGLYRVELEAAPDAAGLRGSGMVVVNLPFETDLALASLLPWLQKSLDPSGRGASRADWLG
jgi:23S rRNA (adenine2030-N6)-methyltransferase